MKKILGVYDAPPPHWVGDGFPARSMFSYSGLGAQLSPFLLLDYAGPMQFAPAARARGVGPHPHRGIETVTITYQGEVDHRDSTGAGGHIGPGDVQWMTAAAGLLHQEYHSEAFTRQGGMLEMVQLWVNLRAKDKLAQPRYQTLLNQDIPVVALPGDAGRVRVIAGTFDGHAGPARTFTPMDVWDVRLNRGGAARFAVPAGRTLALAVLHGTLTINGSQAAHDAQLVQLDRDGADVQVQADTDATFLLLSGEPIDEPIVGHGPFVMNTQGEIAQAIEDFQSGRFGQMQPG